MTIAVDIPSGETVGRGRRHDVGCVELVLAGSDEDGDLVLQEMGDDKIVQPVRVEVGGLDDARPTRDAEIRRGREMKQRFVRVARVGKPVGVAILERSVADVDGVVNAVVVAVTLSVGATGDRSGRERDQEPRPPSDRAAGRPVDALRKRGRSDPGESVGAWRKQHGERSTSGVTACWVRADKSPGAHRFPVAHRAL